MAFSGDHVMRVLLAFSGVWEVWQRSLEGSFDWTEYAEEELLCSLQFLIGVK